MERTNLLETLTIFCLVELLISGCLGQAPSNDQAVDSGSGDDTDTCQGRNCQCSGGPCCDEDGTFKVKSDTWCEQKEEYRCIAKSCGLSREYRIVERFCSGASAECDGDISDPAWLPLSDCHPDEVCELDEHNVAQCSPCGELETCQAGVCACEFEICQDVCCAEGHVCRWSDVCGIGVTKLLPSDGVEYDFFGGSVSISGNIALIGASGADDNGTESGAVYVFERDAAGGWIQVSKLLPSDCAGDYYFGSSASASGDFALIGAPYGVNDSGIISGTAYVFERDATGDWIQKSRLLPSDGADYDGFGGSVSISGNMAFVGAAIDDDSPGAVYIFERNDAGNWEQISKPVPSDAGEYDRFGRSVSVSGNVAIIGAPGVDFVSGAAYIFERKDSGNWIEKAKLLPSDGEQYDGFGTSVFVSGDVAIIGSENHDAIGIGPDSGAAYIFERNGAGDWIEKAKLLPTDAGEENRFGNSVAVSGDFAIIGSSSDFGSVYQTGAAFIFQRNDSGHWIQKAKLLPTDGADCELFGTEVSVSEGVVLVGASHEDAQGAYSGAAYVF